MSATKQRLAALKSSFAPATKPKTIAEIVELFIIIIASIKRINLLNVMNELIELILNLTQLIDSHRKDADNGYKLL